MTRIAILSPSVSLGDATSNDVFGMHSALSRRGLDARVYAEGSSVDEDVWPAQNIRGFLTDSSDFLLYHHATGWEFGIKLLKELKCRTAIKYHNVTPPEFFERFSTDYARQCREGREQMFLIASADYSLYLSDSEYNARELRSAGVPESKSFIVPPFHHVDRLFNIEPESDTLDLYQDNTTNILTVGRVVPNKGHPALIEAFAAYHHDYNRNSRLIIVGREESRLNVYNRMLREITRILRVKESVIFTGAVSDSELKAHYLTADVFMMASEHEGFCVPVVEAMALKVPIVAYQSSAIPETIGNAGLLWKERNPYLFAESVNRIVSDQAASFALGVTGWQRYEQLFSNEKIEEKLWQVLNGSL